MPQNSPLDRLRGVGLFIAPGNREIRPVTTRPDQEAIEILTGGKVFFEVDGATHTFARGAIFWHITGENTVCRTPPEEPYRCLSLRFSVSQRRRRVPRISQWADENTLDAFVSEAMQRFHDADIDNDLLGDYLYSRIEYEAYIGNRRRFREEYPKPLAEAIRLLRDPESFTLSVGEIALRIGVSEPYLYSLFSRHLESSPHQFQLNSRLHLARTLLARGDESIKGIAEECGFDNLESFYRAFRRHNGVSPGEYRRRQLHPRPL